MGFNHKAIFTKAHQIARMKKFNNPALDYRATFAAALSLAYADARRQAEWRANAAKREAQRHEQNIGYPVRSFYGERTFIRTSRNVAAIGA